MSLGGYFELELGKSDDVLHPDASFTNSGRNALELILRNNLPSKIWVPSYTCEAIIEPIKKLNLKYQFYGLDSEFLPKIDSLHDHERIIYNDYYGLGRKKVHDVIDIYGKSKVIIDAAQAYFTDYSSLMSFYSPRKFFGVPDGGLAFPKNDMSAYASSNSVQRFLHLIERIDFSPEQGFFHFKENEEKLKSLSIMKMSKLTHRLLNSICYEKIKATRTSNFECLHKIVNTINQFRFLDLDLLGENVPYCYPLLIANGDTIREKLIKRRIYIPKLWPNEKSLVSQLPLELNLTENLLAIPIDQRLSESEIHHIGNTIFEII